MPQLNGEGNKPSLWTSRLQVPLRLNISHSWYGTRNFTKTTKTILQCYLNVTPYTQCLRFSHWLTLCTLNMHILTYLLT